MTLITGHQVPVPGAVLQINNVPGASGYRFEWVSATKRLQYVRLGSKPEVAMMLADGIDNQNLAIAIAHVFGAGMAEARKIHMCDLPKIKPQPQPTGGIDG